MAETSLNVLVMCNKNWPHICYWDGFSASATVLDNSPAGVFSVCMHQNALVAAVDHSNTIHWTETTDITAWPDVNQITIEPQWGSVTNLVGLDDRVLIFCEKGILYLTGDIQVLPSVGILHPEIGAARDMVSQYGSTVVFGFLNNLYVYDGSINILTEPIRDRLRFPPHSGVTGSEKKIFTRFARTSGQTTDMYVFDKPHFGGWAYQTFPTTSGVGQSNPVQGIVKYISYPWDCVLIPGGNGNLYAHPFIEQTEYIGKEDVATSDYLEPVPVVSSFKSRELDFGDRVLSKQFRRGVIYGEGEDIIVTLYFTDKNKNVIQMSPALSSTTLPCQFNLPFLDGTDASIPSEFTELAIKITGTNILIQAIYIDYRPTRYNLITIL